MSILKKIKEGIVKGGKLNFSGLTIVILLVVILGLIPSEDYDKPQLLTEYRVVYDTGNNKNTSCSDIPKGDYVWWAEEKETNFLFPDVWVSMGWCSETEEGAKENAEKVLTKRLITDQSKSRTYKSFISKEDVVVFEDDTLRGDL